MKKEIKEDKAKKINKIIVGAILTLTFFLFLGFGLHHLTKFVTADEHYWIYERVPQYWKAIGEHNAKKTLINDKPGITVALISGAGLLFEKNPAEHKNKIDENLTLYGVNRSQNLYFAYRFPILLFCGLFLFFFFWVISVITNKWIALWSTIFIGLSPVLIGISQIINPDAFLWLFSSAAIFSYCAFLKKQKIKYAIFAAVFTGLAILSKYTANILFPFYIFLLVLYYIAEAKEVSKKTAYKYFKYNIPILLLVGIGAIIIISFFLPAVFKKPIYLYRLTIGFSESKMLWWSVLSAYTFLLVDTFILKNLILFNAKKFFVKYKFVLKLPVILMMILVFVLVLGRNLFPSWQLFEIVPFDIKNLSSIEGLNYFPNFLEKALLELNAYVFSITPVVLFLAIYAWTKCVIKKSTNFSFYIIAITFFMLIYIIASIKAGVLNTIRYNIILYPLISFLAAIGLYDLVRSFSKKWKIYGLVSLAIVVISSISLLLIQPFYFSYTNFLLPKDKIIVGAWGYGGYEAAEYLNKLPDAENITIWADYYGVCEFFKGKCITNQKIDLDKYPIDYYIITRRGGIRYNMGSDLNPRAVKAGKYYSREDSIWRLNIDNRPQNYIKIFKADGPILEQ